MLPYIPERNFTLPPTAEELQNALITGNILQAMCSKCDEFHNLHVDLGSMRGFIPREETGIAVSGSSAGKISLMSRVGKAVSFQILGIANGTAILSRKAAQQAAGNHIFGNLRPGKIIHAVVQNPASFGVFCDIGCGLTALMRIDRCCISRLESTAQLFKTGQDIYAAILSLDEETGRIELTGKELLGTWKENAALFHSGEIVTGVIRSIMPYGIFVELAPNLSGLAEYQTGYSVGEAVSVYIRSIQPEKHKIKLSIVETLPAHQCSNRIHYFITDGNLTNWEYYAGSNAFTIF